MAILADTTASSHSNLFCNQAIAWKNPFHPRQRLLNPDQPQQVHFSPSGDTALLWILFIMVLFVLKFAAAIVIPIVLAVMLSLLLAALVTVLPPSMFRNVSVPLWCSWA